MTTRDADQDRAALAAEVWGQLRRLVTETDDPRRRIRDELGLSFVKAKALRRLESDGPLTHRELTDALSVDPPYTTLVVDSLEQAGLVQRQAHPTDRRAKQVHLTDPGRLVARRAEELLGQPPAPMLELSLTDLRSLHQILGQVLGRATSS